MCSDIRPYAEDRPTGIFPGGILRRRVAFHESLEHGSRHKADG